MKATSFATLKDLEAYIRCLQGGHGSNQCYAFGDNGRGAWGDVTAQIRHPMCAVSSAFILTKFGHVNEGRGMMVNITIYGVMRSIPCYDLGPDGVVDLNPAALRAFGMATDTELDVPCDFQWSDLQPERALGMAVKAAIRGDRLAKQR